MVLPDCVRDGRGNPFLKHLRSKCFKKDWEQTARPKGTRPKKNPPILKKKGGFETLKV